MVSPKRYLLTSRFVLVTDPKGKLLQLSKGCRIDEPWERDITIRKHALFVDVSKAYQESHKIFNGVYEITVQANHDTREFYRVEKCAEIIFKGGKIVKSEKLQWFRK